MNYAAYTLRNKTIALLGTASFIAMANVGAALAQQMPPAQEAGAAPVTEEVLVTGSLIRGAATVGSPVAELSDENFKDTGALTIADLFKDLPSVYVTPSLTITKTRGNLIQVQNTEIHDIGGDQSAPKTLLMVDGIRTPIQGSNICLVDPSIIPQLAVERVDVLADGASATYGSDALAGVINVVLKRGFDGAISQFQIGGSTDIGGLSVSASQLFGRTWDGGDVTVTYEYYHVNPIIGPARSYYTFDYSAFGLDDRTPLSNAAPGIISTGKPTAPANTPAGFSATTGTTCINCYAIPAGQAGGANGSANLSWASILANNPTSTSFAANESDPYAGTTVLPSNQRSAFVATLDQNVYAGDGLVKSVQLFADGYYNNRRAVVLSAGNYGVTTQGNALTIAVPTNNTYYPTGAPSGLQVSYDFAIAGQDQGQDAAYAIQGRYDAGFNIGLPWNWEGKIQYAKSEDSEGSATTNQVNTSLVSAALGYTIAASSTYGSFIKPAAIPYLNLFCDPHEFVCNSPTTLAYITATNVADTRQNFDDINGSFDGPLFDLPGGTVKLAVGGDYLGEHYMHTSLSGSTTPDGNVDPTSSPDHGDFDVIAGFGQLNVPLISKQMDIPLVDSLGIEASGRIDDYSNVGQTKNYRLAVDWSIAFGFTARASMGTSFRAPNFADLSAVVGSQILPINANGGNSSDTLVTCSSGTPAAGSAAAILNSGCSSSEAKAYPGGIFVGGQAGLGQLIEPSGGLRPETSRNWNLGFEFAPTDFLKGLDVQATLWYLKIDDAIAVLPSPASLDNPEDLLDGAIILNTNPNFNTYLTNLYNSPLRSSLLTAPSNIMFIENQAELNTGFLLYEGVDFSAIYAWDLGDLGAWNAGVNGTYQVADQNQPAPGMAVNDEFVGKDSGGRLAYRTHLGWAGGDDEAWSVTAFMDYKPHVGSQQWGDNVRAQPLPPACFISGATCASYGSQFSQYTTQYPNFNLDEPSSYTFDLSIGYKTGDRPADDNWKNIAVQLTVNDIFDKEPRFAYVTSTSGGSPDAFDRSDSPLQRTISLVLTKNW